MPCLSHKYNLIASSFEKSLTPSLFNNFLAPLTLDLTVAHVFKAFCFSASKLLIPTAYGSIRQIAYLQGVLD